MSKQVSNLPRRLQIARRWQWGAAAVPAIFVVCCFVGWPFSIYWPSVVAFAATLPSIWLFNAKCYACRWPAFVDFVAEKKLEDDKSLWVRVNGKELGGIALPLPSACTKCGATFVARMMEE